MRILAIETSGRSASVAVLEAAGTGAVLLREAGTTRDQRTAQALFPVLHELLRQIAWPADSVELVMVAVGPGSFTGLRIGVTLAKTFAYAVGAEVIGVNTLAVLAEHARDRTGALWAIMDAQRQELFAAKFIETNEQRAMVDELRIMSQADWLAALKPGDLVTGPALRRMAAEMPLGVRAVDESYWDPTANAVGRVGWRAYYSGLRNDIWKLVPEYYRLSAAEEKRARR